MTGMATVSYVHRDCMMPWQQLVPVTVRFDDFTERRICSFQIAGGVEGRDSVPFCAGDRVKVVDDYIVERMAF